MRQALQNLVEGLVAAAGVLENGAGRRPPRVTRLLRRLRALIVSGGLQALGRGTMEYPARVSSMTLDFVLASSLFIAGGAFVSSPDAFSQDRPMFTQHERQLHGAARPNSLCQPSPYETVVTYSELTVSDSREVVYRISTVVPCLGQVADPPWALRWDAPSGTVTVFRHTLSALAFERFKIFLDRADVKGIESFRNAGPGVGDFKIAIARPSGDQNVDVLSLLPTHFQLVNNPALIHLICKAKDIARTASRAGQLPAWCADGPR